MTSAPAELRPWRRRRWWITVALVLGTQISLIFWLSEKAVPPPRRVRSAPRLSVAGSTAADLVALSDPTLFALPHRQGFSGLAWLKITQPPFRSFDWPLNPRWLELSVRQLGATFDRTVESDGFNPPASPARPEPEFTIAAPAPLPAAPACSSPRLEGGLSGRRLLAPLELPPMRHTDLLTDSVVQIVVNPEGRLVTVPVLLSSSGSKEADARALRIAGTARVDPIIGGGPRPAVNPTAQLAWGSMVFEWLTLPVATTNTPAAAP
ncbi:MAG: energy transducer TonB [Verrucomicrobiota bacterium]